jgi:hypothetical protein
MQKTANEIKSSFELLASGHYQIHSFLYAQEFEQQAYENLIYPLMLVYPLGGSLSGTSYTRNYRVVIADRVLKSEGNELEVESDTQLIALDVLAYWMKLGTNERFSITSSNTITPFWEKWGDEVTGHFVDIGIEEFYDFNSCAIPLSGSIPSPVNPCKDARILINSVIYGNAPSDTNFNVVVKDQLGALVGSLIGGEWIVNTGGGSCPDSNYTIEDSLGNVLYTGTIPSGGSATEVIGNSTLNVNKSDGTLISSRSILAEGTDSYNVGDSSAVLKDEDGNVLSTTPIKATETEDIVAPNGDVSVNSVAFDDVLSGGTLDIEVLKSTGNDQIGSKQGQYWRIGNSTITNSDSSYDVDVKATESLVLPDSQINVNGVDEGDVVSVKNIDVNLEDSLGAPVVPTSVGLVGNTLTIEVPSGATPSGVLFKTIEPSQYTSYRTGDEGSRVQNGWFDYTPPSNPKTVAELDFSSANSTFVLKNNLVVNGISNKLRYVDINGVQTFSATGNANRVIIDKLTGLMYTRIPDQNLTFNSAIDNALSKSLTINSIVYDDWYLPTLKELIELFNFVQTAYLTDPNTAAILFPSFTGRQELISATTNPQITTQIIVILANSRIIYADAKTASVWSAIQVTNARNLITAP